MEGRMENSRQASVRLDANVERGRPVQITVDGEVIPAFEGESVAAAMLAAGRRVLRHTHLENQPRGIFCGMGVCFECLVTVACVAPVQDGMRIFTVNELEEPA